MSRVAHQRIFSGALACALAGLVVGCSGGDSDDLQNLASCGEFVFPTDAKVIWFQENDTFGDTLLDAVVEITASSVPEFKQRSQLNEFAPGVPKYWRQTWSDIGEAQLLARDAGNEHLVELNKSPTRWVVIHDSGATRQLFLRAGC
ncbi:hypothetical protein [Nocardia neocaledoniensis]|uniref:hypothetical protein n=1 Tax=Nocardia neocaledoniensis TaxID=236511 RepID=UPI0024565D28|nr:hypothetical protein [Nocardia neocaledoniensis]